jgi:hypothetical protein
VSSLEENIGDYATTTKHVQINEWDIKKRTRQCGAKNADKDGNTTQRVTAVALLLDCERYKTRKAAMYLIVCGTLTFVSKTGHINLHSLLTL